MNELKIFSNEEFGEVRTVTINDNIYFCGKDVCKVFGDKNHNRSLGRVDNDDKTENEIFDSMGRKQKAIFINESGLYSLLFTMQPQKSHNVGVSYEYPIEVNNRIEKLHRFKKWVTSEVLPSIRKHGAYMTQETIEKTLTNPDFIIGLAQELKKEQEERKRLEAEKSKLTVENITMKPKAEYFDELVDRNLLTNIRETAKELKVKEKVFVGFLLEKKYLYRDAKGKLLPYAKKNNGLFEIKECFNENTNWSGVQTLVTPKGRETFRLLLSGLRD